MIDRFFKKWYDSFGFTVSENIMKENVLSEGNLPWHIFTWGNVSSIEGEDALIQLFEQPHKALIVFSGYPDDYSKIKYINSKRKLIKALKTNDDVYVTANDYSWTFVKTHESSCGPYFKIREKNDTLSYNIENNVKYYMSVNINDICDCDSCKHYYTNIKKSYPELDRFLCSIGVDIELPFESVDLTGLNDKNDYIEYLVWYIVMGKCGDDYSHTIGEVMISKAQEYPPTPIIDDEFFVIEIFNIKLPFTR